MRGALRLERRALRVETSFGGLALGVLIDYGWSLGLYSVVYCRDVRTSSCDGDRRGNGIWTAGGALSMTFPFSFPFFFFLLHWFLVRGSCIGEFPHLSP